ncbi:MAG: SWIM zinc finger family protein [Oscillospiraceae bacterium]|jgi:hypothetical protein|nr:SWIM zinc finger family protein [Oscillospiraceae bacterium]
MNLKNFEKYFDGAILKRGLDYYKSGRVENLEFDDGTWTAYVIGSDDYEVTVAITNNGDIEDTSCDCPYDWGDYCKHQAAVLFAVRNQAAPKSSENKQKLEAVLGKLDKQTLLGILLDVAGRDRGLKEELLMRYSDETDALGYAKWLIKSAIKSVKRRGFVEYGDTERAAEGAYNVLEMADDLLEADDIITAVSLCTVVLDEMVALLDMCDDSDGDVGGAIGEALEKISKWIDTHAQKDSEKLFDIIYQHAIKTMYDGWISWRMDLLGACLPLCSNSTNRARLEAYLAEMPVRQAYEWGKDYDLRERQKLQYSIIEWFDGDAAAENFIDQHVENPDFRRIAIQNAVSSKQYDKALKLCLGGEEKEELSSESASGWKHFRYEIYEETKDTEAQKALAKELFLDGSFDYFIKLKALYEQDEWPLIRLEILEELDIQDHSEVYVEILIHEKLKLRLLDYCKNNIDDITELYPHLLPECKNDVGVIFTKYIQQQAETANDRSMYRSVCDLIRLYKKACGAAALDIRKELASQYPKRPAFLDELSKVK